MNGLRRFVRQLLTVFRSRRSDRSLDRELAAHLRLIQDDYERRGLTPDAARRAARLALGGIDQTKELHRGARSFRWLDDARRDVVYAVRMLRRRPIVAAAATMSLAAGIGLNAAVFSVVDWVLLRPLPYPAADELVRVFTAGTKPVTGPAAITPAEFSLFSRASGLRAAVALNSATRVISGPGLEASHVLIARIDGDLFATLGVYPQVGRPFSAEEVSSGAAVVMLSHDVWQRSAQGNPAVVGGMLAIDGVAHTVVGVMPLHRGYPGDAGAWRPMTRDERGDDRELVMIGRLRADATVDRLSTELATMAGIESEARRTAWAEDVQRAGVADVQTALHALIVSTLLVLLIACANVVALISARGVDRAGEMALRGALGASRARLLTQLMTESLVLAAVGGVLGLVAGRWALDLLVSLAPVSIPRLPEIALDGRVVGIGIAATVIAGIVVGVVPALRASRTTAAAALHGAGWGRSAKPSAGRRLLVAVQIALAVVLATGAGLFARSLTHLVTVDNGFTVDRLVSVDLYVRGLTSEATRRVIPDALALAHTVPGVEDAAVGMRLPTQPGGLSVRVKVVGGDAATASATLRPVSDRYFDVIQARPTAGRAFAPADDRSAPLVAIVNESLARALFAGGSALGARLTTDRADAPLTIVGVVPDLTPGGEPDRRALYLSTSQILIGHSYLIVRAAGDPGALIPVLRARLRDVRPGLALDRVRRVAEALEDRRAATRFNTQLVSTFAVLALLLAAIGIYGLAASDVAARWREFAIRVALGASRRHALWTVVRPCLVVAAIGALAGAVCGFGTGPLLASLLHGVTPADPVTLLTAPSLLAAVGVVAALLASVRILRADPADTLRRH